MWPDITTHPKFKLLKLVNQVRSICHGKLYKQPSAEAYDCLDRFRGVLRAEFEHEATDDDVRESVDAMFKNLLREVTRDST